MPFRADGQSEVLFPFLFRFWPKCAFFTLCVLVPRTLFLLPSLPLSFYTQEARETGLRCTSSSTQVITRKMQPLVRKEQKAVTPTATEHTLQAVWMATPNGTREARGGRRRRKREKTTERESSILYPARRKSSSKWQLK